MRKLFSTGSESSDENQSLEFYDGSEDSSSEDEWDSSDEWDKIQLDENYSVSMEEMEQLSFTLKQLIRKLHISKPVQPVMSLLGKLGQRNTE